MMAAKALAFCILAAANTYQVPASIIIGVLHVEGGRVGQEVGPNINGTYDLGPMQINTHWLPQLARAWKVDVKMARHVLKNDSCMNVKVGTWILRKRFEETGSWLGAIARYHSPTPHIGNRYAKKVLAVMYKKGLFFYARKEPEETMSKEKRILYAQR